MPFFAKESVLFVILGGIFANMGDVFHILFIYLQSYWRIN